MRRWLIRSWVTEDEAMMRSLYGNLRALPTNLGTSWLCRHELGMLEIKAVAKSGYTQNAAQQRARLLLRVAFGSGHNGPQPRTPRLGAHAGIGHYR